MMSARCDGIAGETLMYRPNQSTNSHRAAGALQLAVEEENWKYTVRPTPTHKSNKTPFEAQKTEERKRKNQSK